MSIDNPKPLGKARVFVVDDHPFFRDGVVQLLSRQPDLICCGDADSVSNARTQLARLKPQLVLLDLRSGHGGGIDFIKCLTAEFPNMLVLVLSQHDELLVTERALRAGARGYVLKEEAADEVLIAIRTVLKGELFVSRKLAMCFLKEFMRAETNLPNSGPVNVADR